MFCARVRRKLSPSEVVFSGELLTTEQVRRAANVVVGSMTFSPRVRRNFFDAEASRQLDHARRTEQAARSYHKTRRKRLLEHGITPDKIKAIFPQQPPVPPQQ